MVDKRVNEIAKKIVPLYVAKGLLLDRKKTQDNIAKMIVEALQQKRESIRAELSTQINNVIFNFIPSHADSFLRNYISNNIHHVHPTQAPTSSAQDLQYQLYLMMKDDEKLRTDDLSIWWLLKIKFEKPATSAAPCRLAVVRTKDHHDDDDACPEGKSSAKK
ncbi:hypothetical protein Tco_0156380 [Tanacetum coccineum]